MEKELLERLVGEIYSDLQNTILKGGDFSALENTLKKNMDMLGRQLLQEIVNSIDAAVTESDHRKKMWNIKRKRARELKTVFGNVELERTYFQHKKTGTYSYLTDLYLELNKYQRLSEEVKYGLLHNVCDLSYAKSGERYDVSAKTVSNVLHEVQMPELKKHEIPKKTRETRVLFVGADEDHISIRKQGKKQQYLIYVYDGIAGTEKRKALTNIHYFTRKQAGDPEDLWLEVADYIYDTYDVNSIEKTYLLGDGAAWIKQGLSWLPNADFVLDKWHLAKYIRSCSAYFESLQAKDFAHNIWQSIRTNDIRLFQRVMVQMRRLSDDASQNEKIRKTKRYILNNWIGIQNLYFGDVHGCSAEGHVSHMLSARLSSRPMAWSENGAEKIAALRVFRKNGGSIKALSLKKNIYNTAGTAAIRTEVYEKTEEVALVAKQVTIPALKSGRNDILKAVINSIIERKKL